MWEATAEAGTFSFLGCLRFKRLEETSFVKQKAVPGETVTMELPKHLLGSQLLFLCVFVRLLACSGVSLCSLGWLRICELPASACQLLLQAWVISPLLTQAFQPSSLLGSWAQEQPICLVLERVSRCLREQRPRVLCHDR